MINPAKGRKFDIDDFAGLLARYEVDVKVEYPHLNSDIQYPATITRAKLKDAFVSWANLESFIDGITQSLYNGAYINRYNFTRGLIAKAYNDNSVTIEQISEPNTEALAKAFLTKARADYLNMQEPSSDFNAWKKVGGYGRDVITWTNPEDIVFLIRNDVGAYLDVNVLSEAFHINKAELLGRVKYVKDFSERNNSGEVVIDGSKIVGMMADRRWFRIKNQELTMDEFYNSNNRTWNLYLNDVNMFQYSLFTNAKVYATALPEVAITGLEAEKESVEVAIGSSVKVMLTTTPAQANTPTISVASSAEGVATATISGKEITITGVDDGTATITATAGNVTTTIAVTVPA